MKDNNKAAIERIEQAVANLKENNFKLYFFVVDCKNIPNGNMAYIYEMAYALREKGLDVEMLYQLQDEYTEAELRKAKKRNEPVDESRIFTGVGGWLGEQYALLPHLNIAVTEWKVSPSDFLFIPEALSSLMFETYKHKIPCKRYVIMQDYNYVTEFIPLGVEWKNYGIYDAIVSCQKQADLLRNVFPYVRTQVVNPCVNPLFRKPIKPKKLLVNIVSKSQNDINRIVKTFYWKYPMYKFVSFSDLRNLSREAYSESLKESAITVWVDRDTPFGYAPLEAMRCGNIVVGKVPETVPEWMEDGNGSLLNNGLWVYDINDIPDVLAKAVASWMNDEIPQPILDDMEKTNKLYSYEQWEEGLDKMVSSMVSEQIEKFNEVKEEILKEKK